MVPYFQQRQLYGPFYITNSNICVKSTEFRNGKNICENFMTLLKCTFVKATFILSQNFTLNLHKMQCYKNHSTQLDFVFFFFSFLSKFGLLVVRRQRYVRTNMNSQYVTFDLKGPLPCPEKFHICFLYSPGPIPAVLAQRIWSNPPKNGLIQYTSKINFES